MNAVQFRERQLEKEALSKAWRRHEDVGKQAKKNWIVAPAKEAEKAGRLGVHDDTIAAETGGHIAGNEINAVGLARLGGMCTSGGFIRQKCGQKCARRRMHATIELYKLHLVDPMTEDQIAKLRSLLIRRT